MIVEIIIPKIAIVENIKQTVIIIQLQNVAAVIFQLKNDPFALLCVPYIFGIRLDHNTFVCRFRQGFDGDLNFFIGNQIHIGSGFALRKRSLMSRPPGIEGIF